MLLQGKGTGGECQRRPSGEGRDSQWLASDLWLEGFILNHAIEDLSRSLRGLFSLWLRSAERGRVDSLEFRDSWASLLDFMTL